MATWLLTWNADRWSWEDLQSIVKKVREGRAQSDRWSCSRTRGIRKGDHFFMLKQGRGTRGIFASGRVIRGSFADEHWDEESSSPTTMYVGIQFDALLDPTSEPILPRAALEDGVLGRVHWNTQRSGILIPADSATALERIWRQFRRSPSSQGASEDGPVQSADNERGASGGGFGSSENNERVERAAIDLVTNRYVRRGWAVESVEEKRIGFDLRCRKGRSQEDVEVKGVSGCDRVFIITNAEVVQAKKNRNFVLYLVTEALTKRPGVSKYSGAEFLDSFVLDPVQFRARLR